MSNPTNSSAPFRATRFTLGLEALENREVPAAVTVTGTGDAIAVDGVVTLREAIASVNQGSDINGDVVATGTYGTGDTINFNIAGAGVQTISPASALPTVAKPVTINGYTQPGASANTLANADNAVLLIELAGTSAGALTDGLTLGAGSAGSTVRGLVVNRFEGDGIVVQSNGNTIAGNFVGVNPAGTTRMPNGTFPTAGDGIRIENASNNLIGTPALADRNVVSGNAIDGIHVVGDLISPATGNLIQNNFVGVAADGKSSVGNRTEPAPAPGAAGGNNLFGIEISGGNNNTVGGAAAGARNVVGLNGAGIEVDNGGQGNTIQGNYSGIGADGVTPAGNLLHGIVLRSSNGFTAPLGPAQANEPGVSNNTIGGTAAGAGNLVAYNGTGGIAIFGNPVSAAGQANTGNAILGNSVFLNGRSFATASSAPLPLLGIDLTNGFAFPRDDGFTANDSKTHVAASSPNNFQNFPVLTAATAGSGGTIVTGTLSSTPNTTFRVELFANDTDPLGQPAEGQQFLGFVNVTTDAAGHATISATLNGTVALGRIVTATATDSAGNTSEFSVGVTVTAPVAPVDLFGPRPNADVNTAIVHGLYHAILNRDADASGLSNFVNLLKQGLSASQVAQALYTSPEHHGQEVDGFYQTYLKRPADTVGRAGFVAALQAGATEETIIVAIISSAEYTAKYPTNAAFVDALYQDVLGRTESAAERANFVAVLDSGVPRATLAQAVVTSTEARTRLVDSFYMSFLQRSSDPSGQGFVTFLQNGGTQAALAGLFAGSAEFGSNAARAVP